MYSHSLFLRLSLFCFSDDAVGFPNLIYRRVHPSDNELHAGSTARFTTSLVGSLKTPLKQSKNIQSTKKLAANSRTFFFQTRFQLFYNILILKNFEMIFIFFIHYITVWRLSGSLSCRSIFASHFNFCLNFEHYGHCSRQKKIDCLPTRTTTQRNFDYGYSAHYLGKCFCNGITFSNMEKVGKMVRTTR